MLERLIMACISQVICIHVPIGFFKIEWNLQQWSSQRCFFTTTWHTSSKSMTAYQQIEPHKSSYCYTFQNFMSWEKLICAFVSDYRAMKFMKSERGELICFKNYFHKRNGTNKDCGSNTTSEPTITWNLAMENLRKLFKGTQSSTVL